MTRKQLTVEHLRKVVHYDTETGIFTRLISSGGQAAGSKAGWIDGEGYRKLRVLGNEYRASRLAFFYVTGKWPKNHIDHKNLARPDNRWTNLREATWSQNNHHSIQEPGASGFRGATYHAPSKQWRARIQVQGRRLHLGLFDTPEEAHAAYCRAAEKYFGEFSTTEVLPHARPEDSHDHQAGEITP